MSTTKTKDGVILKKHQVHLLATDNKSNLCLDITTNKLVYDYATRYKNNVYIPQHLYITSDEEIKERDWYYHVLDNEIHKSICNWAKLGDGDDLKAKKIVATTNPDLSLLVPTYDRNQQVEMQWGDFPKLPKDFIEVYIWAYNLGKPITEVMLEHTIEYIIDEPFMLIGDLNLRSDGSVIIHRVKERKYTREEFKAGIRQFLSELIRPELACKVIDATEDNTELKVADEWFDKNYPE